MLPVRSSKVFAIAA